MSKQIKTLKGFDKLISSANPPSKSLTVSTLNHHDGLDGNNVSKAKYKSLKKCTLYLPEDIMDSLAMMKIKTKKDLSELTAEALKEYLIINKFLNI